MAPAALVVLTTLATEEDARRLVTALVEERLVACGTLVPGGRSSYRWEGGLTAEGEVLGVVWSGGGGGGGARGHGRPGDGGARPRRAGGARARQRRAAAAAGRSVVLAPALHGRAARSGARAATGAGEPRRAGHARPGPVPQGPVDRGGGPVQERRGARSGAHGGVVLPGRGAEPRGRPHRGPHGVRARGRARAGAREGAVRLRHRARSAEPPGRRDADVPPLAGGRGQGIRWGVG